VKYVKGGVLLHVCGFL